MFIWQIKINHLVKLKDIKEKVNIYKNLEINKVNKKLKEIYTILQKILLS